jgi:hypothetical protein
MNGLVRHRGKGVLKERMPMPKDQAQSSEAALFINRQISIPISDPDFDNMEEGMVFRLTYEGPLQPSSRDEPRAKHKHEIRKLFHPQLRRLWQVTLLKDMQEFNFPFPSGMVTSSVEGRFGNRSVRVHGKGNRLHNLAERFVRNGFRFVPLVTQDLFVACGIDVLFLRPDPPGEVLKSGDIDNRLKTLFDALRMPIDQRELGGYLACEDEEPFYCLLEDDRLISKVSVETDLLLEPTSARAGKSDSRLVITVSLRPYKATWTNLVLG